MYQVQGQPFIVLLCKLHVSEVKMLKNANRGKCSLCHMVEFNVMPPDCTHSKKGEILFFLYNFFNSTLKAIVDLNEFSSFF